MEDTRNYLGLFIIVPEKQEAIDEVTGSISSVITENTGDVIGTNMVGAKKLSYPIKKKETGIYYEVTFTAQPESVPKMIRQFRINLDILRTLIDKKG